jgi:hypothetical protein
MRWLFLGLLLAFAIPCVAQTTPDSASRDSSISGKLRPRWGTYIASVYPTPAKFGAKITVQFYNHNPEMIACRVFDLACRLIMEIQPKQSTASGLHTIEIPQFALSSGTYFLRLTTFTASGAANIVDNARFVVIK